MDRDLRNMAHAQRWQQENERERKQQEYEAKKQAALQKAQEDERDEVVHFAPDAALRGNEDPCYNKHFPALKRN